MIKLVGLAIVLLCLPSGIAIALITASRFKRWIDLQLNRLEKRHYEEIENDYKKRGLL